METKGASGKTARRDMRLRELFEKRAIAATVAVIFGLSALVIWRCQPPAARTLDAATEEFSAERALSFLRRVLGDGEPHPGGVVAHLRVRERLLLELRGLGYVPEVQETLVRAAGGRIAVARNVVVRAREGAGKTILLCAHYDSVGAGPGAADDGSGVACLLEIARALRAAPVGERPVMLLFTDVEEAGLLGASAFVEQHPAAAEVGVVINLEARGTSGPSMLFETSGPNAGLIEAFARSAARPWTTSVAELVYKNMPNDTDLSVFRAAGIAGYNFAFIGGLSRYHTALDDLAHLDPRSVQHQGDNALALLRHIASSAERESANVVFADVLSCFVMRWPLAWTMPLGVLALAISTTAIALALRRRAAAPREFAVALARLSVAALVGLLACSAIAFGLHWLHGAPDAAAAHPWPMRLVVLAAMVASFAGLTGQRLAQAQSNAYLLACVATLGLASLLSALFVPEASYLVLVPAFAASGGALFVRPRDQRGSAEVATWLALPAWIAVSCLWMPIAYAMELGFNYALAVLVAGPLAPCACLASVMLAAASPRARRRVTLGALLLLALASVAAALVPTYSVDRPGWLNLRYIDDSQRAAGRWEISTFGLGLPATYAEAGFVAAAEPPFDWLTFDPSLYVREGDKWSQSRPELSLLESRQTEHGRRLRCRARSVRGASRLHLHLPENVLLESVACTQGRIAGVFEDVRTQLFFGVDESGLELELAIGGSQPVDIWLLDQDWEMPPDYAALRELRPDVLVPRSDGDVSILGTLSRL